MNDSPPTAGKAFDAEAWKNQELPLFSHLSNLETADPDDASQLVADHRQAAGTSMTAHTRQKQMDDGKLLHTVDFIQHLMAGGTVVTHKGREYKIPIDMDPNDFIKSLERPGQIQGRKHTFTVYDEVADLPKEFDLPVDVPFDKEADVVKIKGMANPPDYNMQFFDHEHNLVGTLRVNAAGRLTLEGNLDESAKVFAKHLAAHLQSIWDGDRDGLERETAMRALNKKIENEIMNACGPKEVEKVWPTVTPGGIVDLNPKA